MKKKKLMLIISIIIFLGLAICLIFNNKDKANTVFKSQDLKQIGYDQETINYINQKFDQKDIEQLKSQKKDKYLGLFIKEKYFLNKNYDEYIKYYTSHLDLEIKDVIAIVNVKANNEGYKNAKETKIENNNYLLVNKYNYLTSNYTPEDLVLMKTTYAYENRYVKKEVNDAFIKMYDDAKKENINLLVASAYRSYNYQENLYNNYIKMYGVDYTDTISAKPGYSEHQTGLALDIICSNVSMREFKNTKAYEWLKVNSYKYGFILRYPEDKTYLTGYAFESWHYRYLGEDLAKKVYDEKITYDEYYAFYLDN